MKTKALSETLVDAARDFGLSKATVDKLESLNIPPVKELSPRQIRALRKRINASQGVFARVLNVNVSTVQKWEQGSVQPQAAALKLLNVLDEHGIGVLL